MRVELNTSNKLCYSIEEFRAMIGVARSTVYILADRGQLKFSKILGKTVITKSEAERFMAALEAGEVS